MVTTVLYLFPPRPRKKPVLRVRLGSREILRWRFEEVFLWELDAGEALAHGAPGLLALLPLMRGGRRRSMLEKAFGRIERAFPGERLADAEDVLLALAGEHYTFEELARLVGRERMMQSSLYVAGEAKGRAEGEAKGRAEGEAKGRTDAERKLCAALARKHHPAVFERARPKIEGCQDPSQLEEWALAASDLSDAEFLKRLGA